MNYMQLGHRECEIPTMRRKVSGNRSVSPPQDISHCLTAVLQGWNSTFNPMASSSVTWLLLISKNKDPQALNRLLSHRSYLDVQSDAHVFVWRFDDFSSGSFCKHLVDIYVLITMLESCI